MVRPNRQTAGSSEQSLSHGSALFSQTLAAQHLAVMSVQVDWQIGCSSIDRAMRFATRFQLDHRMNTILDVQLASQL
jgi:hypothetical protein